MKGARIWYDPAPARVHEESKGEESDDYEPDRVKEEPVGEESDSSSCSNE